MDRVVCPECSFECVPSRVRRTRHEQTSPPESFWDGMGEYHEHPGKYRESFLCEKGHTWTLDRSGGRVCRACQGAHENPTFPDPESHVPVDFASIERRNAERKERNDLLEWLHSYARQDVLQALGFDSCANANPGLDELKTLKKAHDEAVEADSLRRWLRFEADRNALEELELPFDYDADDDALSLDQLSQIKAQYDEWVERHKTIKEELEEVMLDGGEVVASALEATEDLLHEFA